MGIPTGRCSMAASCHRLCGNIPLSSLKLSQVFHAEIHGAKYNHESFDECWSTGDRRPLHRPPLTPAPRAHLDRLYRPTTTPRLRTWPQRIVLAAVHGRKVPQSARPGRASEATVLRWRTRSRAAGRDGGQDAPALGAPRRSPRRVGASGWRLYGVGHTDYDG